MSEAGRLGRNFSSVAIAQLVAQGLAFVVSVMVARTLGVEEYGIFVFGFAFPTWFLALTSAGMDAVLTIEVAADRSQAGRYLTTVTLLRLGLALLTVVVLWIAISIFLVDSLVRTVTLVLGIGSVLGTFSGTFTSIFRAYERLEFDSLVILSERSMTTGVVLLLLFGGFGLIVISAVYVLGGALMVVFSLVMLRARFVWFERGLDTNLAVSILKKGFPFAMAGLVGTLVLTSGQVLLTFLAGLEATGVFNAAFALILVMLVPLSIYARVFLPTMSRMSRDDPDSLALVLQKSQRFFFTFGLPISLGGLVYSEEIITLIFGPAFESSAASLQVLLFVLAANTATTGAGTLLAATGHQRLVLYIQTLSMASMVGLCLLLIPPMGSLGAAYAFLMSSIVHSGVIYATVRRVVTPLHPWDTLARPIFAGMVMVLALLLMPPFPLLAGIVIGAGMYFGLIVIVRGFTREDWVTLKETIRGAAFR